MIFGIGIDIVEVARIAASIQNFGEAFLQRVFTPAERTYCANCAQPAPHYAARFAAKEAIAKALGTGLGKDVSWQDMEIRHSERGAPYAHLSGHAAAFCQQHGIHEIKISLTHTSTYAAANAVALMKA